MFGEVLYCVHKHAVLHLSHHSNCNGVHSGQVSPDNVSGNILIGLRLNIP